LDKPTSGEVTIDGQSVFSYSEQKLSKFRNQHIGFIFQFHYLLPEFSALENVMIPRMIKGNDWKKDQDRAAKLLNDVGLSQRINHRPNQLSGGEQQRVAVARALMNQPQMVLADEPTGDLDPRNSQIVFDYILELNQKYGQSFVIVTHNEMFAEKANRVVQIHEGKMTEKLNSN
jgi:lipoprotein-releasing system ATP-binding protein